MPTSERATTRRGSMTSADPTTHWREDGAGTGTALGQLKKAEKAKEQKLRPDTMTGRLDAVFGALGGGGANNGNPLADWRVNATAMPSSLGSGDDDMAADESDW